jgi:hypothetical protein
MDPNRTNRMSATFFIDGLLTEDVDMFEKQAASSVDRSWLTPKFTCGAGLIDREL